MASADLTPLSPALVRGLNDKLYDKRKQAAQEVERLVQDLVKTGDQTKIQAIIKSLSEDFVFSTNTHSRKGGLIGLAAVAIALNTEAHEHLGELFPPIVACFEDTESKVRYYACEALFNISKVCRGHILRFFNTLFDHLCKLVTDPDSSVRNACALLDRLIKDIVTETRTFDVPAFIPLLSERISNTNANVRQFLVSWITVLDSVPEIDMLVYLPKFLEGLFKCLGEMSQDIRAQVSNLLDEFLRGIKAAQPGTIDFPQMTRTLTQFCTGKFPAAHATSLLWLYDFILLARDAMLPFTADLLAVILPSLSHKTPTIRNAALDADLSLMSLVVESSSAIAYDVCVAKLAVQLLNEHPDTRLAALEWLLMLQKKSPAEITAKEIFPALLKTLSDPVEDVARVDIELLAQISSGDNNSLFYQFIVDLLSLFSTDRVLLDSRGALIIRQLCVFVSPELIFRTLAEILVKEEDLGFCSIMVQHLNWILLTAVELQELRRMLKHVAENEKGQTLFVALYKSWSHNSVATLSLCLLAQAYEHACSLIERFAEVEITVTLLVEIDKLVQLLESPIFTSMRLQMVEPEKHPYLFKCIYGILMLLPQSSAFATLRNRISSVTGVGSLGIVTSAKLKATHELGAIDGAQLLAHFRATQERHDTARKLASIILNQSASRRRALLSPAKLSSGPQS